MFDILFNSEMVRAAGCAIAAFAFCLMSVRYAKKKIERVEEKVRKDVVSFAQQILVHHKAAFDRQETEFRGAVSKLRHELDVLMAKADKIPPPGKYRSIDDE